MGLVSDIAQSYRDIGQAHAAGQRDVGQIYGNLISGLGQLPEQIHKQQQADQIQQQEATIRTQQVAGGDLELQAKRRAMLAQDALGKAMSSAVNPDGSFNTDLLQKSILSNPATAAEWPKIQEGLMAAREKSGQVRKLDDEHATAENEHVSALANAADAASDPTEKAGILLAGLAQGVREGSIDRDHGTAILSQVVGEDGQPDPAKVSGVLARMKQLSAADVEKRAQAAKATTETAGAQATQTFQAAHGGLTPEQIAQQTNQATTRSQEDQRIALEKERVRLEGARLAQGPEGVPVIPGNANAPEVAPGQLNESYLASLPSSQAALVKALAEGRKSFPSGAALRAPYWQGILGAVAKYDPSFDEVNYNARSKTRADFTSGASSKQINAINTAIGHLDTVAQAVDALGNFHEGSLGPLTTTAKIPNFNIARKAVSDEVTRVWRQAGGSEKDIQETLTNLSSANSPEQLYGGLAQFGDLLESKLNSMREQFRQGMGTDAIEVVTPHAREVLTKIEAHRSGGNVPSAAPAASTAPKEGQEGVVNGTPAIWKTVNGKPGWYAK